MNGVDTFFFGPVYNETMLCIQNPIFEVLSDRNVKFNSVIIIGLSPINQTIFESTYNMKFWNTYHRLLFVCKENYIF